MEKFGTIDPIVRPAPPEVWLAWRRSLRASHGARFELISRNA
jgi:hypothetical protein